MSLLLSNHNELITQMNAWLGKSRDPVRIIQDPLIGVIVEHGNWKYIAKSMVEAFDIASLWKTKHDAREKSKRRRFCSLCFKNA